MRIAAGIYKNSEIATPGEGTHPMGSRERLALFNMITEYLPGSRVLDVFAGSGALGIEALSRGAESVIFIEKNPKACETIKNNLKKLKISATRGEVIRADVYAVLGVVPDASTNVPINTSVAPARAIGEFGVVLADPPYDNYDEEKIKMLTRAVTTPNGVLVLSHPTEVAPEMPGLTLLKTRKYASAHISIYKNSFM
ncbi:16S rRNA (guanine(966)-N(2))-methyltransferase RsmD [Candidatus Saccharibacteria bacterium]|nr:16S rRNA (guanine(966)-N(2))-methyltransferase RsmD [Candidatus Saccharibacteria bacterium]